MKVIFSLLGSIDFCAIPPPPPHAMKWYVHYQPFLGISVGDPDFTKLFTFDEETDTETET